MPRWIDICCPECGTIQEVRRDMNCFVDVQGAEIPCPDCGCLHCKELPPLVNLQIRKFYEPKGPRKKISLADEKTPLPNEVRQLLAKELFDPCSCGEHAPVDLEGHEAECHVNKHSFMKNLKKDELL
ncbi:hypothetical protein WDW89_22235 [Deltaproteobacteria bacterium TL4]